MQSIALTRTSVRQRRTTDVRTDAGLEETMTEAAHYSELDLSGAFTLSSPRRNSSLSISLPGDVHSALLAAGEILDPYFGTNEQAVMWVHATPWTVERASSHAGRYRWPPDTHA